MEQRPLPFPHSLQVQQLQERIAAAQRIAKESVPEGQPRPKVGGMSLIPATAAREAAHLPEGNFVVGADRISAACLLALSLLLESVCSAMI